MSVSFVRFPDVILFRVFGVLAFGFFVSQFGSGKVVCEKGKTKLGSVVDQLYCPLEQPRVRWVGFYSFSSFRSPWDSVSPCALTRSISAFLVWLAFLLCCGFHAPALVNSMHAKQRETCKPIIFLFTFPGKQDVYFVQRLFQMGLLTSEFYFSLYSFMFISYHMWTLSPCSCGAEKFQLPSLCLPLCLFVVLFIEPSCHSGGRGRISSSFFYFSWHWILTSNLATFVYSTGFLHPGFITWHSSNLLRKKEVWPVLT